MKINKKHVKWFLLGIFGIGILVYFSPSPSHDHDWITSQAVLPSATVNGDQVHIKNVRNFSYKTKQDFTPAYYNEVYDLSKLTKVYFIVSHFSEFEGLAHTFLSFEFSDGKYLSVSVESRREKEEAFTPLKGILKQYEMIYVLGDERDLIKLRTHYRDEEVYLYPANTTPENAQKLLLSILNRVNQIYETPEFYNTITNNCANAITRHIEAISDRNIPPSYKIFLPGYSDKLAHKLKLIPHDAPIEEIRKRYRIDVKAQAIGETKDFSRMIRSFLN